MHNWYNKPHFEWLDHNVLNIFHNLSHLTWVRCLVHTCYPLYDWGYCCLILNQMTQSYAPPPHTQTHTYTGHKRGGTHISCCISVTCVCVCVCFDILTGLNLQFEQHIWYFVPWECQGGEKYWLFNPGCVLLPFIYFQIGPTFLAPSVWIHVTQIITLPLSVCTHEAVKWSRWCHCPDGLRFLYI